MSAVETTISGNAGNASGEVVRVLVADDQEAVRKRICSILRSRSNVEVCAEASTGREAVDKAKEFSPDLILLDITMPVLNGLDAARLIRAAAPNTAILIVSVHRSKQLMEMAKRIGIQGYVTKGDGVQRLIEAVDAVLDHRPFFPTDF
jgi:DNA-binding NarL/FixJ family response regulator